MGDDRRIGVQRLESFGDATVQQTASRKADPVLGDRAQALVTEVVYVVALGDQAAGRQLLQRACDLVLGTAADDAQRLGVEAAADQCSRDQHLGGGLAD